MIPNSDARTRIGLAAIIFVFLGLAASLRAGEIKPLQLNQLPGATKILSFPSGQCAGNLYLVPESGADWDPKRVTRSGELEYLAAAQGDVSVPKDRSLLLQIILALSPLESARLRAQNPLAHQLTTANRVRKDPDDLSGLSQLDPKDLYGLSVHCAMHQRTGTDPGIFEPICRLTGLRLLCLIDTGITDKGLEHLRPLRSLRSLELMESSITARGLAVLRDLPDLEYLDLHTEATDAGLKQVGQHPNLRWLRIRTGKIWGPGLAELANMSRLERLCIWGTSPISDQHMKYLEGLTQIKSLTLWGVTGSLTDASLASTGKLKSLEELYFIHTSARFTVAGLVHLKNLRDLKKVDFAQIWTGPHGVEHGDEIVRQLAALSNLESVKGLSYLSAEGMKTLTTLRNLKCLDVTLKDRRQDYYGPTGVSHLANLESLEELHLSGSDALSDADLAYLEPLSRLRELFISGENVTERGMVSVGKLKRLEKLTLFCPVTRNALNQLNGLANLQHLQVNAHRRGDSSVVSDSDELMLDLSGLKKMRDMNLTALPLCDSDLAFLKNMPLLENLTVQPISPLTGESLRHLKDSPRVNRLLLNRLSHCTSEDVAHLNSLPKLRSLTLIGDITDSALRSLTGPHSLESIRINTDEPILRETVAELKNSHPVLEFIHINELPRFSTRPRQQRNPPEVRQPRTNRRTPRSRR